MCQMHPTGCQSLAKAVGRAALDQVCHLLDACSTAGKQWPGLQGAYVSSAWVKVLTKTI